MIYWVTGSITSSMRFYYELFHGSNDLFQKLLTDFTVDVPTAASVFPKEIFPAIESFAKYIYTDLRLWSVHEKGGHFAALEEPELLVNDLRSFKRIIEGRQAQENKKREL
jgi:microsomal epoxide hydrolase